MRSDSYPNEDSLREEPFPDGGGPCLFLDMPSLTGMPICPASEPRRLPGKPEELSLRVAEKLPLSRLRALARSTTSIALCRLASIFAWSADPFSPPLGEEDRISLKNSTISDVWRLTGRGSRGVIEDLPVEGRGGTVLRSEEPRLNSSHSGESRMPSSA